MNNIIIYSSQKTNRLQYVIDFINENYQGVVFENRIDESLTGDKFILEKDSDDSSQLQIPNKGLVTGGDIDVNFSAFEERLIVEGNKFNFDFLSAIFYLLTRAEEYNSEHLDKHNRFQFKASVLYKKDLLEKPVIDYWLNDLLAVLKTKLYINASRSNAYRFVSTLDIDHISAYKHKSLSIFLGSMMRDVLKGRWKKVAARFWKKDPFDTFDEIVNKHRQLDLELKVFILCASRSRFDKSLPPENKEFIYKVQNLSDKYEIGIHPSYKSNSQVEKIDNELKLLESIIAKNIKYSRFHYIRIQWPDSYRALVKLGIAHDFSMGYPDALGFRAGTSLPFNWYDLENESKTNLRIHPFQIMDVTLRKYLELSTNDAITKADEIINCIREAGGTFSLLWHNSSFFGLEGWEGWKEVYDLILKKAKA